MVSSAVIWDDVAGRYVYMGQQAAAVVTPPAGNDPTSVTAGSPATLVPAGADVPADLAALQALGDLGQAAAWAADEYVVLGDGLAATWDGSAWAAINPGPVTEAVAGTPGSLNNAAGNPVDDAFLPADLTALQALGALGNTTVWATGENVVLGDASTAHWDGSDWAVDVAP